MGVYEPNNAGFAFQQFGIFNNNITINGDWYVGGAPNYPIQYPNLSNFTGFIDEFILLSGDSYQQFLNILPSGFWSQPTGYTSGQYVITGQFDYVSGVVTGYSGITGYQNILTGTITDSCGNVEYIYRNIALTGAQTGIYLTSGTITTYTTGYSGVALGFEYDLGFFNSLGMEGITILYEIQSGNDTLEYFANSVNNIGYFSNNNDNKTPLFSSAANLWVVDQVYDTKTIPVYRNGQLQLESGYLAYQIGYGSGYILSGDYFLNQTQIESTGLYSGVDVMVYDYNPSISGNSWLAFTGISSGSGVVWNQIAIPWNLWNTYWNSNVGGYIPFSGNQFTDFIYVNGQKMTSGVNITQSGQILLDITGVNTFQFLRISGLNSLYPTYNQVIFDTGSVNTPKFLKQTSITFYNGIRQSLDNDYYERGLFDRLTGSYFQRDFNEFIYNNTNDFLNL